MMSLLLTCLRCKRPMRKLPANRTEVQRKCSRCHRVWKIKRPTEFVVEYYARHRKGDWVRLPPDDEGFTSVPQARTHHLMTGQYGVPGEETSGRVHIVQRYKGPVCGTYMRPTMEFQFCSYGIRIEFVECGNCKRWAAGQERVTTVVA